jgi:hypothetical protein
LLGQLEEVSRLLDRYSKTIRDSNK